MIRKIAVIAGDGIGPEVIAEAVRVLTAVRERASLDLHLEHYEFGAEAYLQQGTTLPAELADEFRQSFDAILLGPLGDPRIPEGTHARVIQAALATTLDLYVYLHPVNVLEARFCPLKGKNANEINFIILSEYSEGLRAGMGGVFRKGTTDEIAFRQCLHTYRGIERFLRFAFDYTRRYGWKKLTLASTSEPGLVADDLWERIFIALSSEFPEVEATCLSVHTLFIQLLKFPESFEVLATCNVYGHLISDLGAQLQGGTGLAASARLHPNRVSIFSPLHNSAPQQAGQNTANPLGAIASAELLLEHLGYEQEARWVNSAIRYALETNNTTRDLGGRLGTSQVGAFIAHQIQKGIA